MLFADLKYTFGFSATHCSFKRRTNVVFPAPGSPIRHSKQTLDGWSAILVDLTNRDVALSTLRKKFNHDIYNSFLKGCTLFLQYSILQQVLRTLESEFNQIKYFLNAVLVIHRGQDIYFVLETQLHFIRFSSLLDERY